MAALVFQRRQRRGANAIEFALTLPIFLFLVFGLADYSLFFHKQAFVDDAARVAVREGGVDRDCSTSVGATAGEAVCDENVRGCDCTCTQKDFTYTYGSAKAIECECRAPYVPVIGLAPRIAKEASRVEYRICEFE